MAKSPDTQNPPPTDNGHESVGYVRLGSHQARLARDERSAALRALAGRLAHQIRNPLAAVRAACNSLREELDEPDQRETLDLTLREIDRMLAFVSATVQTIPVQSEPSLAVDVAREISDVVDVVRRSREGQTSIEIQTIADGECLLPRNGFRVAVYSLLDHLVAITDVQRIVIHSERIADRLHVHIDVDGSPGSNKLLTTGMMTPGSWMQPVGLLVAERFARDLGGRLLRSDIDSSHQTFNLELPCNHV